MTTQQITVDFSLFAELEKYFTEHGQNVTSMTSYLDQFVAVSNPLGFLLQKLIGPFLEGKLQGLGALQEVVGLFQHTAQTMTEYANDVQQQEQAYLKLLGDLLAIAQQHSGDAQNVMTGDGSGGVTGQVTAADLSAMGLTAGATATSATATGTTSGVLPGGTTTSPTVTGYTPADLTTPGLNPVTTATAPTTDATTATLPDASGAASATVTIHEADGDTITITPGSDQQPVTVHDGGDTYTVSHGADGGLTVDVSHDASTSTPTDAATPMTETPQTSQQSAMLDKIWDDVAKDDPLGRSGDELRAAWEGREDPPMPSDTSIGFHATNLIAPTPASSLVLH